MLLHGPRYRGRSLSDDTAAVRASREFQILPPRPLRRAGSAARVHHNDLAEGLRYTDATMPVLLASASTLQPGHDVQVGPMLPRAALVA